MHTTARHHLGLHPPALVQQPGQVSYIGVGGLVWDPFPDHLYEDLGGRATQHVGVSNWSHGAFSTSQSAWFRGRPTGEADTPHGQPPIDTLVATLHSPL